MAARGDEAVFRLPGYARFWTAETVSGFGTYITTLALQVLVVVDLQGSATDVGLLNAARWLPYVLVGLLVGALIERSRRQPLCVATDLGRALLLWAIPVLWATDLLSVPVLMGVMAVFGLLSLVNDAASQSLLPRLVPRQSLVMANARLNQSAAVAETSGPALAGGLVTLLGAPVAVLVDAVTYLVSGLVIARIKVTEAVAPATRTRGWLGRETREGLAWIYRHPTLAPLALSTHAWFVCNSMLVTVYVPFALLGLGLSAFELGITLAGAGVGGLLGSLAAPAAGRRWGAGPVVIACRAGMPVGWGIVALAPAVGAGDDGRLTTVAVLLLGQLLVGLAMGLENANEMGYWMAVTPDALQGRMNSTRRSVNRGMIVLGAPLGGVLADALGHRPTLWIALSGFVLVAGGLFLSPFRHARQGDQLTGT